MTRKLGRLHSFISFISFNRGQSLTKAEQLRRLDWVRKWKVKNAIGCLEILIRQIREHSANGPYLAESALSSVISLDRELRHFIQQQRDADAK